MATDTDLIITPEHGTGLAEVSLWRDETTWRWCFSAQCHVVGITAGQTPYGSRDEASRGAAEYLRHVAEVLNRAADVLAGAVAPEE